MILERIGPDRFLVVDDRILDWVARRIPNAHPSWGGRARGLGVSIGADIVAGMVIFDYDRRFGNAEVAFAAESPRWATRSTIAKLMSWPFGQLGCRRLTTLIAASNTRAIRFNEGLGFQREGLIRKAYGDEDAVILGLLREDLPAWAVAPTPEIA